MDDSILSKLSKEELIRLLQLPDHLRKTLIAVLALKEASASTVAKETGRSRAVESGHLNQLERMGFLKRRKRRRTIYFSARRPSIETADALKQ